MNDSQILKIAAALGVLCGLIELYEAITFVEDVRRGSTNVVRGVFIFILPVVIMAGAAGIYLGRIVPGAGAIVVALGLQHYLVEMAGRHYVAVALGLGAVFVSMYVQRRHDLEATKLEQAPS
jgi:hypothetical protein